MKPKFRFKSREPFFSKEKSGIKNNTVRSIDLNEDKFKQLIHRMVVGWNPGDIQIEIISADDITNQEVDDVRFFVRNITDISVYNHTMIITWDPVREMA